MTASFLERAGGLSHYWYAAARSDELGTRRPIGRTVLGVRVALFRDRAGAAVALRDRCLHRNAKISEGDIVDGCIGCPYHGWTYDGTGRLVNVPSMGPGAPAPEAMSLRRFPVREQDGLVWVWVSDREPDRAPFSMPHYDEPGWDAYYMTTRFGNGVTNLVENFMDVPHTVYVHRGWFRTRRRKEIPVHVERTKDSVLVTYEEPNDEIGFSHLLMNPRRLPLVHTDKFYLPNNTRVDYVWGDEARAFVITSTCTPISEFDTMVYTLISYKLGAFNRPAKLWLPWYTRRVIQQDVEIMQNQGDNLQHGGAAEFHGTDADVIHQHIEALREWAQNPESSEPPPPVSERVVMWV